MPFSNQWWTSERIQFLSGVGLVCVLGGLLYRNEWSSISGILNLMMSDEESINNKLMKVYEGVDEENLN